MPHLLADLTGSDLLDRGQRPPPWGPGFAPDILATGSRLLVTGTLAIDPGPDWVRYDLWSTDGTILATKTLDGF